MVRKKSLRTTAVLAFGTTFFVLSIFAAPLSAQTHVVSSGENLSQIASRYNTSISKLTQLNSISNPNLIFVGQQLTLPGTESVYFVKPGDTLSGISLQLGASIPDLAQRNGISNPNFLRIGQTIRYTSSVASTYTSTSAPTSILYRVRRGDTLGTIANRFDTSVAEIAHLNNILPTGIIYVKDLLRVPSPLIVSTIYYWATEYGVPPDLLLSLTWWESGWDNTLISHAGAIGIGQLIPDTVTFVSQALIGQSLSPYVPAQNVQMSARFLAYLLAETDHNINYTLAAYYQGLGAVRRHGVYRSSWSYVNGIQVLRTQFQ